MSLLLLLLKSLCPQTRLRIFANLTKSIKTANFSNFRVLQQVCV